MSRRTPDSVSPRQIPEPWRPRFGIAGMLLMMLVFSMMAAAAYYLVQAIRFGGSFRLAFIFVTLMTPLLLMIGVGVGYRLLAWHERRTRRRQRSAAD